MDTDFGVADGGARAAAARGRGRRDGETAGHARHVLWGSMNVSYKEQNNLLRRVEGSDSCAELGLLARRQVAGAPIEIANTI